VTAISPFHGQSGQTGRQRGGEAQNVATEFQAGVTAPGEVKRSRHGAQVDALTGRTL
jgi:hypothetical protein